MDYELERITAGLKAQGLIHTSGAEEADGLQDRLERLLKEMPYDEYLKTRHWREIRTRALRNKGKVCQVCSSKSNLDVHHRTYEHRGKEQFHMNDLTILCRACHEKHHHKDTPEDALKAILGGLSRKD